MKLVKLIIQYVTVKDKWSWKSWLLVIKIVDKHIWIDKITPYQIRVLVSHTCLLW